MGSEVEELAWLVKDNLLTKHLVLSVEETFVEFLQTPFTCETMLELQPMPSYQRMLLHRLAGLFGLAHESVGEGESRHIVVQRWHDSTIPPVLVSNVVCGDSYHSPTPHLLVRRAEEEEEEKSKHSENSTSTRPRSEPAVAKRMIAHALGKQIRSDPSSQRPKTPDSTVAAHRMFSRALGLPVTKQK